MEWGMITCYAVFMTLLYITIKKMAENFSQLNIIKSKSINKMETIAANVWQKSKLLIKGLLIGGLVFLLLIPAYFVQELIREREARQKEAFTEVSSKWAGRQNITGPVLVIPYNEAGPTINYQITTVKKYAYILPDNLTIQSTVNPEKRYRGIYQVMLYSSDIKMSGKFNEFHCSN